MRRYLRLLMVCLGVSFAGAAAPALAATVTYNLDDVFSPPTGSVSPLARVTLTDHGYAVKFDLLIQAGAGWWCGQLSHDLPHPKHALFWNGSVGGNRGGRPSAGGRSPLWLRIGRNHVV